MPVTKRLQFIDLLRGLAILLMVLFHGAYDLTFYSLVQFNFYSDPFWLSARTLIVSMFLSLVGVSLVLASSHSINWRRYSKRMAWLLASAALITLSSYFMFPGRTIVFGILHFVALASLLGLLFSASPYLSLITGIGLILVGTLFSHPLFNQPALHWIGLMTFKPATEDYVPLLPWMGVVLLGISAGHLLKKTGAGKKLLCCYCSFGFARLLALAGRHSLLIYMLHQPVLLALLWPVAGFPGL